MIGVKTTKHAVRFSIGDSVVLDKTSNASLNLYQKAKSMGMVYIYCPCNIKAGMKLKIEKPFGNGVILRDSISNKLFVAHLNDLRKVD